MIRSCCLGCFVFCWFVAWNFDFCLEPGRWDSDSLWLVSQTDVLSFFIFQRLVGRSMRCLPDVN